MGNYSDLFDVQLLTISPPKEFTFRINGREWGYQYLKFVMPGNITARFGSPERKFSWVPPKLHPRFPFSLELSNYSLHKVSERSLSSLQLPYFIKNLFGEKEVIYLAYIEEVYLSPVDIPPNKNYAENFFLNFNEDGTWEVTESRTKNSYAIRYDSKSFPLESLIILDHTTPSRTFKIPQPLSNIIGDNIEFYNRYNSTIHAFPIIYGSSLDIKVKHGNTMERIKGIYTFVHEGRHTIIVLSKAFSGIPYIRLEGFNIPINTQRLVSVVEKTSSNLDKRLFLKALMADLQFNLLSQVDLELNIFDMEQICRSFAITYLLEKTKEKIDPVVFELLGITSGKDFVLYNDMAAVLTIANKLFGKTNWSEQLNDNKTAELVLSVFKNTENRIGKNRKTFYTNILAHTIAHALRDAAALVSGLDSIIPIIDLKDPTETTSRISIVEEIPATGFASVVERNYDAYLTGKQEIIRTPNDFMSYLESIILTNRILDTELFIYDKVIPNLSEEDAEKLKNIENNLKLASEIEKILRCKLPSEVELSTIRRVIRNLRIFREIWLGYIYLKNIFGTEPFSEFFSWFLLNLSKGEIPKSLKDRFKKILEHSSHLTPEEQKDTIKLPGLRTLYHELSKTIEPTERVDTVFRGRMESLIPLICTYDDSFALTTQKCGLGIPSATKYLIDYLFLRNSYILSIKTPTELDSSIITKKERLYITSRDFDAKNMMKIIEELLIKNPNLQLRIPKLTTYIYSSVGHPQIVTITCLIKS